MSRAGALVLAAVLLLAGPAAAQVYRWVDERGVAHYTEGRDSVPERFRATAVAVPMRREPPAPAPAAGAPAGAQGAGTAGAKAGATGEATIKFTPGERIMVDAQLNGSTSLRLMLDTGADRTVISPRVIAAAGISLTRGTASGTMKGATGEAQVQAVPVESIEVGAARVSPLVVISHDIDQSGVDGLLGRDFLDKFTVTIDNSLGLVTLTPKKP